MTVFQSAWNAQGGVAVQRRQAMLARLAALRALEARAAQASAKSRPVFDKRGQLLPRERVALLLDPGAPWLPLCSLAGFMQDHKDPVLSVPGGGIVAGIGFIEGARCMVVAGDWGIEAGVIQAIGFLGGPAASFISGTVLRVDGARPQVRMGWPMRPPDAEAQQRAAVKPFDGFHLATTPKVFQP